MGSGVLKKLARNWAQRRPTLYAIKCRIVELEKYVKNVDRWAKAFCSKKSKNAKEAKEAVKGCTWRACAHGE